MVIAYHLIWTGYGTWLPNDPRGSGSQATSSPQLAALGDGHFGRRRTQPSGAAVRRFYAEAEPLLLYPVIRFNDEQIREIAASLAATIHGTP